MLKDNCQYCKSDSYKGNLIWSSKYGNYICRKCYQRVNRPTFSINPLPNKGEISYDVFNQPICHICGEGHGKLMSHVTQKHKMSAYEYKKEFGLETTKGVMCESSTQIARKRNLENYDKVVKNNLVNKGVNTRFEKGSKGRTRDQVSLMTRNKLIANISKTPNHGKGD